MQDGHDLFFLVLMAILFGGGIWGKLGKKVRSTEIGVKIVFISAEMVLYLFYRGSFPHISCPQ